MEKTIITQYVTYHNGKELVKVDNVDLIPIGVYASVGIEYETVEIKLLR